MDERLVGQRGPHANLQLKDPDLPTFIESLQSQYRIVLNDITQLSLGASKPEKQDT